MGKRISELPAAAAIADTDELEVNQSGVSRKATRGQVIAGLASIGHQHILAEITDAGALAALDVVGAGELGPNAVTQDKIADGAIGASQLQPGIPINMQDAVLTAPELRDYAETSPAPSISSGTLTLDLETGNVFEIVLTEDVTSLLLANPPAAGSAGSATLMLRQDATGGRTVAWPSSVRWAGGTPPLVTPAANAVDVYAFITRDGGATWFGFPGGQDFS